MTPEQRSEYAAQIKQHIEDVERRINDTEATNVSLDRNELTDDIDRASVEENQRREFQRLEYDKLHLRKLKAAYKRVHSDEFGYCQDCGEDILPSRLKARPESFLCTECQQRQESNQQRVFGRIG